MSGWAIVTQRVVVGVSILAVLLLLHSFSLPQHGDSAIGTAMVLALALLLMAVVMVAAAPVAVHAIGRGVPFSDVGWLCAAVAVPLALWLVVIWRGSAL